MARTILNTVRVTDEQWNRAETEATKHNQSPNHLLVQLAMDALDYHKWPRTGRHMALRCRLHWRCLARTTAGNHNISIRSLASLIVPLPPLESQLHCERLLN